LHCSDDEGGFYLLNASFCESELLELYLVGRQLWFLRALRELLDALADGLLPEPLELVELGDEFVDLVLRALD
jgi:hypothetical protein